MKSLKFEGTVITSEWLKGDSILSAIFKLSKNYPKKIYLVGGYLRDKLLSRESKDLDLLIEAPELKSFGQDLAQVLKGSFFYLDKTRGIARLAIKNRRSALRTVDLTPLKEELKVNLESRDFTIDALSLDLDFFSQKNLNFPKDLIDFSSGFNDLKARKIRATSIQIFKEDPLRILRAIRLALELGFEIEEKTKKLIREQALNQNGSGKASLLSKVSAERIQEELFLILSLPAASGGLKLADSLGVVELLFPELSLLKGVAQDRLHHLDVWDHTLLTLEELEKVIGQGSRLAPSRAVACRRQSGYGTSATKVAMARRRPKLWSVGDKAQGLKAYFPGFERNIESHLKKKVQGRSRLALLKLGALFHDLGKPQTQTVEKGKIRFLNHPQVGAGLAQEILKRFKVGKQSNLIVSRLIKEHLRPGFLAQNKITSRAIHRFFRSSGNETVEVILLSLADRLASKGPASTRAHLSRHLFLLRHLVKVYFKKEAPPSPPLLTGKDLIKNFNLEAGPLIGKLLKVVKEAQFEGRIRAKKEAFELVKNFLAQKWR